MQVLATKRKEGEQELTEWVGCRRLAEESTVGNCFGSRKFSVARLPEAALIGWVM